MPRTLELRRALTSWFSIEEMGSTLGREVLAGVSLYASLAYIFVVNPAILSQAGIPSSAVFFATVCASGFATLAMGLWAKLPFAVAPGLEANGFFAFVVVGTLGFSWQSALGIVFWSGVLCMVFTALPARQLIIDALPDGLKAGITVAVGAFVVTIGLMLAGMIRIEHGIVDGVGSFVSIKAVLLYLGLGLCMVLSLPRKRLAGDILIAIIICVIAARLFGLPADVPQVEWTKMFSALGEFNLFDIFLDARVWSSLIVFFLIDFYGSVGKFIGLTAATNLYSHGKVKNMGRALYVDGAATSFGAFLGTSTMITFVESAIGIAAGARTGLTAVVCGVLMLLSLIFTPLIGIVPVAAMSGVLVYVGYLLLPVQQIKAGGLTRFDGVVLLLMGLIAFLTFSLDKSMLLGFALYSLKQLLTENRLNPYLAASTLLMAAAVAIQFHAAARP